MSTTASAASRAERRWPLGGQAQAEGDAGQSEHGTRQSSMRPLRVIEASGSIPEAVTADRGYGQASVDPELAALGIVTVAIPRKGKPGVARQGVEAEANFVELIKWRTGAEGRISALKRQQGWSRARLRGLEGARIWCGWRVLSHNAVKIAALSN